jgi:hypothetical protein
MAVLNTVSFEDAVDLINRKFLQKLKPFPGTMKTSGFVNTQTITIGTGNTRRHKEPPHSDQYAAVKVEGGNTVAVQVQQGYYNDTTASTYAFKVDITRELRTYDKTGEYRNAVDFITGSYQNREDLNLSMQFSFGTATTYVDKDGNTQDISTGDGLALWQTAHTLTGSATTYRNRLANNPQFSEGALENMEDLWRTNIYNNLGEQVTMEPDIIWTTDKPQLVNAVRRELQSTAQISAPNDGVVNVYEAKYKHVVLKRADMTAAGVKDSTKGNYWGMASSMYSTFMNDEYMSPMIIQPSVGTGMNVDLDTWTWTVEGAHNACVVVGRGLSFSSGDGTA